MQRLAELDAAAGDMQSWVQQQECGRLLSCALAPAQTLPTAASPPPAALIAPIAPERDAQLWLRRPRPQALQRRKRPLPFSRCAHACLPLLLLLLLLVFLMLPLLWKLLLVMLTALP